MSKAKMLAIGGALMMLAGDVPVGAQTFTPPTYVYEVDCVSPTGAETPCTRGLAPSGMDMVLVVTHSPQSTRVGRNLLYGVQVDADGDGTLVYKIDVSHMDRPKAVNDFNDNCQVDIEDRFCGGAGLLVGPSPPAPDGGDEARQNKSIVRYAEFLRSAYKNVVKF